MGSQERPLYSSEAEEALGKLPPEERRRIRIVVDAVSNSTEKIQILMGRVARKHHIDILVVARDASMPDLSSHIVSELGRNGLLHTFERSSRGDVIIGQPYVLSKNTISLDPAGRPLHIAFRSIDDDDQRGMFVMLLNKS